MRQGWAKRQSGKRGGQRLRLLAVAALSLLALFSLKPLGAASAESLEYEVKAAMLFNFTRFVDWPASAWRSQSAPFVIAVAGGDPFGPALDETMRDKMVARRPVQVRRIRAASEARDCQIIFLARSERKRVGEWVEAAQAQNALLVSDIEQFTRDGGTIGFVTADNKVRFEVNSHSATKAGLTISSKLLRLATKVRTE